MQSVFNIDPRLTDAVKTALLSIFEKNGLADLLTLIKQAVEIRRWDFNAWEASFFLVLSRNHYARIFVSLVPEGEQNVTWIYNNNGEISGSFDNESWRVKNHLQGFSPAHALSNKAKSTVHAFDNTRVYDSLQHACEVGQRYEFSDYLFTLTDRKKSIVDPAIFYAQSNPGIIAIDSESIFQHHLIKAANPPVASRAIINFGEKMLPRAEPKKTVLLVSLEAEKRKWTNQEKCLTTLIKKIKPQKVILNGMTAPVAGSAYCGFEEQKNYELRLITEIINNSGEKTEFSSLFGLTLHEKAEQLKQVSFSVMPGGSAFLLPNIMHIPGVVVGNKSTIKWRSDLDQKCVFRTPIDGIIETDEKGFHNYDWGNSSDYVSYHIDEKIFIDTCEQSLAKT